MEVDIILVLLFIIISILAGVILKVILKRTFIPYTVGLFILGLMVGLSSRFGLIEIPDIMGSVLKEVGNMNPEIILYIFLPILIFEASLNLDIHIFRKSLVNASILAIPGVIICMLLTGAFLIGIKYWFPSYNPEWNWTIALMFGALISATDPVAVVALLNELKTSKRFSTLVDAESMLNDGTGIVFFMLFFGTFTAQGLHYGAITNFVITVAGAVVVGYLVALISLWGAAHINSDPILQNSILFIASYILFYVTNRALEVSGVIALVTFGVVVAYYGPTTLRPSANKFIKQFWELTAYLANTLIFIIVGIMIAMKCDFIPSDFAILAIVYVAIMAIRGIMIFIFYPIMKRQQYGITPKEGIVLTWGGLRGALGLTLALLVFYTPSIPETARHQILFLTGGIVTLTLTLNATTMGWLLKKLNLTQIPSAKLLLEYNMRTIYRNKAQDYFNKLKNEIALKGTDWNHLEEYLPEIGENPVPETVPQKSMIATIRNKIMEQNLSKCMHLYQEGIISAITYKRLTAILEEIDDYQGEAPFTILSDYLSSLGKKHIININLLKLSYKFTNMFRIKIVNNYDFLHAFIIIEYDSIDLINDMKKAPPFRKEGMDSLEIVEKEIIENINVAKKQTILLSYNYPIAFNMAINDKARRLLLRKEKMLIRELGTAGMLSQDDEEILADEVGKRNCIKIK